MKSAVYWTVLGLMLASFGLLKYRGDVDRVPPSAPLDQIPTSLDGMTSVDVPMAQETLDVLGKGFFLSRVYAPPPESHDAGVGLFIGYFPTQRTGQAIHSPQHCLPGAGWIFSDSGVATVVGPDGVRHEVGDYLVTNGTQQAEVLYWYKTESLWIANDWVAKYYMLLDSMRYSRTDAALVRITTPVRPGEQRSDAQKRAIGFARALAPLLPAYIPN